MFWLTGDRAHGPAVIHDWLYQRPDFEDRAMADAVLYEAMGVNQPELGFQAERTWTRALIYAGVRVGGWVAWRNHGKRGLALNPVWHTTSWPEQGP